MDCITMKKYHGLGNDYLVLDPNKNEFALQTRNIEMLCRRNFGVGADGLLYGPIMEDGKIKVRIFNPDGSEAEKSGNGVRIFAKYLLDEGYVDGDTCTMSTLAGDVEAEFVKGDGSMVRANMGKPIYAGEELPLSGLEGEVVNAHLRFHDNDYNTTCLSVGNPNCVIMMEEVTPQKARALGPYVEGAPYFPNRTRFAKSLTGKTLPLKSMNGAQGIRWRPALEPAQRQRRQNGWGLWMGMLPCICRGAI